MPVSELRASENRLRTHSFGGLGAAGIQVVGWARQREVAGFCTGPATVLRPGGALLSAGEAAVGAAALGLGNGRAQDLGQVAGRDSQDRFSGEGQEEVWQGTAEKEFSGPMEGVYVRTKWQKSLRVRACR